MAYKVGTKIGVQDTYFREICVGDTIESGGKTYTIDKYGRAKPTDGGNVVPVRVLKDVVVKKSAEIPAEEPKKEDPKPAVSISDFTDDDIIEEAIKRGLYDMSRVSDVTVELEAERRGLLADRDLSTVNVKDMMDELTRRGALPAIGSDTRTISKVEALQLLAEDKDLCEELRRRGYTVTASKLIEL